MLSPYSKAGNDASGSNFELQQNLSILTQGLESEPGSQNTEEIHQKIHAGHCVRQIVLDDSSSRQAKEQFRNRHGFQAFLTALANVAQAIDNPATDDEEQRLLLEYLQVLFGILSAALHDHEGNQRFFRRRVDDGGWQSLKGILTQLLRARKKSPRGQRTALIERVLGCLLACALNDEFMTSLFPKLGSLRDKVLAKTADEQNVGTSQVSLSKEQESLNPVEGVDEAEVRSVLKTSIDTSAVVCNPEALSVMLELWKALQTNVFARNDQELTSCLMVPGVLSHLANLSTHNLQAMHRTSLLETAMSFLLTPPTQAIRLSDIRNLVRLLLQLGVSSLEDAHLLYRSAASSPLVADTLLQALRISQCPPYIHFDLSMHGYASVELPGIGRSFPPTSPSAGYTLSMWLHIVNFDPNSHTTIFGAFDSSQTCFVLVYLEKDTHNLILQTSVTSSRPSVRFKSMAFRDKRWYHIVIVHRRPRTTMSSRASLFVDGRFVEQIKSNYPEQPPSAGSSAAAMNGTRRSNPVQAFLGTPQDLATRFGKDLVLSQWRLASAHLFGEALSDDLLAVYHQLGPKYHGNYQDRLGSFQTYEASAHLNLLNERLHPGKEDKSDIVIAVRQYASILLPESLMILNIAPTSILNVDNDSIINQKQLLKGLGKQTSKNLRHVTRGRNAIIINGAIPAINEALHHSHGFAVLTGDPVVVVPQGLDDSAWRIGGCAAIGLSLVEAANTPNDISTALDILLETIKGSWRNSEAMERENGFGVLATLLANKLDLAKAATLKINDQRSSDADVRAQHEKLSIEVLSTILRFVGYQPERPQDSVINNPLAYRILLVDLDLWRQSGPAVQRLYYKQFVIFGSDSRYHAFNAKRLSKMRIAKKWIDALKGGDLFYSDTFELFIDAFRTILTVHPASETLRSLALFITYAIHKPTTRDTSPLRPTKSIRQKEIGTTRRQTLVTASPSPLHQRSSVSTEMTRTQIAMRILRMYTSIVCDDQDTVNIRKFARTVTNRWLLFLLANNDPSIVALATKILARLLVVNGTSYMKKFNEKTGGIVIMQRHLKRWWSIPSIWPLCFAILFGQDVASINLDRNFDLYNLMEALNANEKTAVVYPEIFPVLASMLQNGLRAITKNQVDPDSPLNERSSANGRETNKGSNPSSTHRRSLSMSLKNQLAPLDTSLTSEDNIAEAAAIIHTVSRFLADVHTRSQAFRDFAVVSSYVQELLLVLFPIVVSSDVVSPEAELHSRDSALTFGGNDVFIKPLSQGSINEPPIIRTASVDGPGGPRTSRVKAPRRMSSYVFVSAEQSQRRPPISKLGPAKSHAADRSRSSMNAKTSITEELLEILVSVFSDQLFSRKDFPGLGLFMKVPPGFQEHQAYFETFVLRNTLSHLRNAVMLDQNLLTEPRVLTNLARFATHLSEAVYEGWFIDGVDAIIEFLGIILEHLQLPEIAKIKSIRLCSQTIAVMRAVLVRVVLLRLSELDDDANTSEVVSFLEKLVYWQTVILVTQDGQDYFLRLLCYLLYTKLVGTQDSIRTAAANLWRMLLVQRPHYASDFLQEALGNHDTPLSRGFRKIMELDNETFLSWIDDHREELDAIFMGDLAKGWDNFVAEENRRTEENSKARINKRKDRLKVWQAEQFAREEILRKHNMSADHWSSNIFASEQMKRQRAQQDQQDDHTFNTSSWNRMSQELRRPRGLLEDTDGLRWQLDQTEGRNRMRMRCIPDRHDQALSTKPKRKQSQGPSRHRSTLTSRQRTTSGEPSGGSSHLRVPSSSQSTEDGSLAGAITRPEPNEEGLEQEEDFEIVEDPQDELGNYDDKNRRVMRSLHRGDQVEHVLNVSRIIGLEACEGLLILGTRFLYLLDNLFQRSDGEIVNVWQAPQLERDPYVQMISGREASEKPHSSINTNSEIRNWPWEDVLSISKRRFLFREVAIEVFFVDGRSYLLTSSTPAFRDELYQKLQEKALNVAERAPVASQEGAWRIESIRNPEDESQTLGSRFTNVFAQSYSNPATRKWVKGEISNFHYLMLVNTMAGRTFNDLTQYPVFPWVLADYTSEELDLTDPRSFRDLTKPMGCQTPERQAEFRERYHVFAEMGNENQPPFHYGTHYSSAMIVTSYLIRLQPFVQSYLLLQGGNFDHPDRLFYSIEKAWTSASRENMTDVRELIPEFYYLPEFLLNSNGFDFGLRQGDGGAIDTVVLPPWAKGDPKIFIAKNREALESEYVSKHLHQWIDLIFGHKQRGEAAFEATNIFHHLSYHGAKDLETIVDPVERLATIGIIHNFGQTPYQIFHKSHPPREDKKNRTRRLDTTAEGLTRLPSPVLESNERVHALHYSTKHDRVMCSSFFRLPLAPSYDKFMEWGYIDDSIRFYTADSRRLIILFEHVHIGQLSTALFADSNTLVTAGTDCTISVWAVPHAAKSVDLQPKACFFGHRAAIDVLTVSKSFSALLSADSDGEVLMWDLNRLKLVRVLTSGKPVECARINDVSGTVMLCRGRTVSLFTLNGDPILDQDVCHEPDDMITSCAFYQGAGNEFLERNLVFTGHKRGVVNVWNHTSKSGKFVLEHIKRMDHLDQVGFNVNAAMTAVLPMPHTVYTGDEDGRVYEWDCIQRQ